MTTNGVKNICQIFVQRVLHHLLYYKSLISVVTVKRLWSVTLYRNAAFLMLESLSTTIVSFVFWIEVARLYPAGAVGIASSTISVIGLLVLFSTLGLNDGLIRFSTSSKDEYQRMVNTCVVICMTVSVLVALVFIAGIKVWSPALLLIQDDTLFLGAFIVFTANTVLCNLLSHLFVAKRHAWLSLTQNTLASLLRLGLAALLVFQPRAFSIFSSWGISWIISAVVSLTFVVPKILEGYRPTFAVHFGVIRSMMRYSFASYVSLLLLTAPTSILPLMVLNMLGSEASAYFFIAWGIASMLPAIASAVSTSLLAEGSHNQEQIVLQLRRVLKLVGILLVPVVGAVFLIGDKMLLIFGKDYSSSGTRLLWVLALAAFPISLNYVWLALTRLEKGLRKLVLFTLFVSVCSLWLSYILVPHFGVMGVGIAWVTSNGLAAIFAGYDIWRTFHKTDLASIG